VKITPEVEDFVGGAFDASARYRGGSEMNFSQQPPEQK
jgi:hypothetical protein